MSDRPEEAKPEEHVDDLDVPESESEDVKGGTSFNYSKIKWEDPKRAPGGPRIDGSG
jgi:hypothetical protein